MRILIKLLRQTSISYSRMYIVQKKPSVVVPPQEKLKGVQNVTIQIHLNHLYKILVSQMQRLNPVTAILP